MKDPYLLHMFNPTKNVSPFDVNMAYEADFDGVIPYTDVSLEDIHSLTQDTIFSRGPSGVKRTGIFVGGRDFGLAMDMLQRARAAMVPPFQVSVFADPSGAITTAAALVACVEHWIGRLGKGGLSAKNIQILGGTGPVGICAGILASNAGAQVHLVSRRGTEVGEEMAREYNARYGANMRGGCSSSDAALEACLAEADVVVGVAKAGVRVLSTSQLQKAKRLLVAADANAVPPPGIEGVEVRDNGKVLEGTPSKALSLGALAIGDVKYKVHYQLFKLMTGSDGPVYLDHLKAFEVARSILAR
ncbi:MAG: NAD(P)-dependent methylenetetrahydromethanopterin dehydrogenase [Gammaproteobacteria bacterium]